MPTTTLNPTDLTNPQLYRHLSSAVAPRPIAFASTIDQAGQVNLSPFSFFNVFGSNPPILVFSPVRRGRDGTIKHTLENLREVPEVVIHMVNYAMVQQMSLASTEYPKGVNEFVKAGFTPIPSTEVRPPRVEEAPVALECKVQQIIETGQAGGAGNLVIAEVILLHLQTQYLDEAGELDTTALDLVGRMGGNWYCRASGAALFTVPKPTRQHGIGVDALPQHVRNSTVLTGNQLGRLGSLPRLPAADELAKLRDTSEVENLLTKYAGDQDQLILALHTQAQALIEAGQTELALRWLMVA